jgi:hypothetical protein
MRRLLAPSAIAFSRVTSGVIAASVAFVALAASTTADAADMPVKAVRAGSGLHLDRLLRRHQRRLRLARRRGHHLHAQ